MFHLTDLGNAERLVEEYAGFLKYDHTARRWYVWNGRLWKHDTNGEVLRLAKECVKKLYSEAGDQEREADRRALAKHAILSERHDKLKAMVSLAQSERGVAITTDQVTRRRPMASQRPEWNRGTADLRTSAGSAGRPDYSHPAGALRLRREVSRLAEISRRSVR